MFSYTVSWNSIPGSACSYFVETIQLHRHATCTEVPLIVIVAGDIMFSYTVSWNSIPGSACSYFAGQ